MVAGTGRVRLRIADRAMRALKDRHRYHGKQVFLGGRAELDGVFPRDFLVRFPLSGPDLGQEPSYVRTVCRMEYGFAFIPDVAFRVFSYPVGIFTILPFTESLNHGRVSRQTPPMVIGSGR